MKLRLLLAITLLALLAQQSAIACGSAQQARILPLGLAGKEVIALHLRMDRGDALKGGETDWDWHGQAMVVSFNMSDYTIKNRLLSQSFRWSEKAFEAELAKTYKMALDTARKLCNLQLLQPQSITICDFVPACNGVKLSYKPSSNKIMLEVAQPRFAVDVNTITFTDSGTVLYYPLAGIDGPLRPDKILPTNPESREVDLNTMMQIGSIRRYQVNGKTLLLVHFGTGEKHRYDDEGNLLPREPEFTPTYPKFDNINHCSYLEPVLYHGTGVDVAFWIN